MKGRLAEKSIGFVLAVPLWTFFAAATFAVEDGRAALGVAIPDGPPCAACEGECRQCGNVPQVNLAVAPENWPPPCEACDPCDPLRTCCPDKEDFFLVPPRPNLYFQFDGAAMRRSPTQQRDFASLGLLPAGAVEPTTVVLSTRDFSYDFTAAGRFLIGHTLNECLQIEGSYLGITESRDSAAVRDRTPNQLGGVGNLFSPFGGFGDAPILGLDYNNFAEIRYASSLQGAELNLRRKLPIVPCRLTGSVMFGVRYIGIPEDFDYLTSTATPSVSSASFNIETDNQLVGPQIGAYFEFYESNRWWITVDMKAAVMNNRSSQSTHYRIGGGPYAGENTLGVREDHTAFAEELAVAAVFRWTPRMSARLGYQALWIQNLALAPNNLNADIGLLALGPAQLNHRSSTVYHGPFAGVTIGW